MNGDGKVKEGKKGKINTLPVVSGVELGRRNADGDLSLSFVVLSVDSESSVGIEIIHVVRDVLLDSSSKKHKYR